MDNYYVKNELIALYKELENVDIVDSESLYKAGRAINGMLECLDIMENLTKNLI